MIALRNERHGSTDRLAKLRSPLYTSHPSSTPASCLQGLNDQSASPIVIHFSRGCSEPLEYCLSTFLPPSAACVLGSLKSAYPGCRVVRLKERHTGFWNESLFVLPQLQGEECAKAAYSTDPYSLGHTALWCLNRMRSQWFEPCPLSKSMITALMSCHILGQ